MNVKISGLAGTTLHRGLSGFQACKPAVFSSPGNWKFQKGRPKLHVIPSPSWELAWGLGKWRTGHTGRKLMAYDSVAVTLEKAMFPKTQ